MTHDEDAPLISPEDMLMQLIREEIEADPIGFARYAREHADSLPRWRWRRRRYWNRWAQLAETHTGVSECRSS